MEEHKAHINGFPDGTFGGEKSVTREQVAKMLIDALGRVVEQYDVLNHKTAYTYDASGNILTVTDPTGSPRPTPTTPSAREWKTD